MARRASGAAGGDRRPHGRAERALTLTDDKRCTAKAKGSGERCKLPAIPGLPTCRRHGSATKVGLAKSERYLAVERIREHLGVPLEVDPHEAILSAVHEAAGNVAYLRPLMTDKTNTTALMDVQGKPHTNPVLAFYNDERDRLARFAKMAIDAGIDERRVRIAESHAGRLGEALDRACQVAGLDDATRTSLMSALADQLRQDAA